MVVGSEVMEEDCGILPLFGAVNEDGEEKNAASEEMRLLYHRLGYLDRGCLLPDRFRTEEGNALVRIVKRCISKVCGFLLYPVIEEQNRINVQEANYLRDMVRQMDRLTAENERLCREVAELREKFSL